MAFLKRWEPLKEILDKFFEEDWEINMTPKMATDVYETDKDFVVEMQVPGYKKDNIKISFQNDYLKVEGHEAESKEEKEKNYWRKEISKGSFIRIIPLPKKIDVKKSKATFKDGILKIVLPKIEENKDIGERIEIEE